MTQTSETTLAALAEEDRPWLLVKRGLYWRPNASGYTGLKSEAGRYSDVQTASYQEHDGETTWRVRYVDAAECSPSCPDDAKVRHLTSVIIAAAEREAMLVKALREIVEEAEALRDRLATRREAFEITSDAQKADLLSDCIGLIYTAMYPARTALATLETK